MSRQSSPMLHSQSFWFRSDGIVSGIYHNSSFRLSIPTSRTASALLLFRIFITRFALINPDIPIISITSIRISSQAITLHIIQLIILNYLRTENRIPFILSARNYYVYPLLFIQLFIQTNRHNDNSDKKLEFSHSTPHNSHLSANALPHASILES